MKIGSAVRPGRVPEKKKRTGQDRTGQHSQNKKSQGGNISPIWGEAPSVPIRTKICMVGSLPDIFMYAKFQVEILGVTILQGVKFPIFLLIFEWALQQCSATALPVIEVACDRGRPIDSHKTKPRPEDAHVPMW